MSYPTYHNLIAGQWVPSISGKTILNLNPANHSDIIGAFPSSHAEDVNLAVEAAQKAFAEWRLVPAPGRAEILYRTAYMLSIKKEEFARDVTRETGKVLVEARAEVQEAIDEAFYFAGEGRRLFGQTAPRESPTEFAMSVRVPLGVVGLITTWNFPMATPGAKLFPALVAGNTCVLKPATDAPLSSWNLGQTLIEAGLPPGVVNIVGGTGAAVGPAIVDHPGVRAISFTGSCAVGALVAQRAAVGFKQVALETGGKSAQVVMDDANLELALDGAISGAFSTTGQRCTATSRILLQKGIAAEFSRLFVERTKHLKIGSGLDETVQIGPQVNPNQIETSARYVVTALDEGARLLTGGRALTRGDYAHGTYFEPTVLDRVTPCMRIAREEVFGPLVSLLEFETFKEAIEIANSIDYSLSVSIYTRDVNRVFTAIRDLEAGITCINAPTIGAEMHLPSGGIKHSGNGHRKGNGAPDFFTTWRAVYVDYC